ncbi:hypothetical protein [Gloeobacter kilaueensis]|nr:hypothetical protein [Gloeobacter kilaueensis]
MSLLPWPEIAWSVVLSDLGLLVVCPLLTLLFISNPLTRNPILLGVVLPLLCGVVAGVAVRLCFDKLFKEQILDNGVGWALVLGVALTVYPMGLALGTALEAVPNLFNLPAPAAEFSRNLGKLLQISRILFDLVFVVGGAMGMFWRAIRIGR